MCWFLGVRNRCVISISNIDYSVVCLWCPLSVADHQKSVWRRAKDDKEHDERFITNGLWGVSRHPKYVCENS